MNLIQRNIGLTTVMKLKEIAEYFFKPVNAK